jgi:hypothetical protein
MRAAAAALVLAAAPAGATVLTFDGLQLANEGAVPATYGDAVNPHCNANGCCDAVGCYGGGNGFTPNVSVEYRTLNLATNATVLGYLKFWNADYGDLQNVAYAGTNDRLGEIALVPAPGYDVILNGFDLGGWPNDTITGQTVRMVDGNGNVIVDFSPADARGEMTHSGFAPAIPLRSSGTLRIQFGPNWRVGIDNVNFDQAVSIAGGGCDMDLECQQQLNATAVALAACAEDLVACDTDVATLAAANASLTASLAAERTDADWDGRRDRDDRCANTPLNMAVDRDGCSLRQFCTGFIAGNKEGTLACPKLDWKNDEPLMGRGTEDCKVDFGPTRSDADNTCLPITG